jgi:hypothetical protein
MGNNGEVVLSKEGRGMARKLWIQRSTRGILDVKRTAPLEGLVGSQLAWMGDLDASWKWRNEGHS